ncbi:MAG: hypothetical protein Q8Q52_06875 [Acidimicrobiia bacterium]|nr:hypothetical protein [Acidimicrobiia bacterium]
MKRHAIDILALVFGLLFLAVGLTFLLPSNIDRLGERVVELINWGGPALVIAAGIAVLVGSLRRQAAQSASPATNLDGDL